MIMGFDHDDPTIFNAQVEFLTEARIAKAMVGMLHAIPKTPLHARLAKEGRLDPADVPEYGTNVIPMRLGREELRDGYVRVMNELYRPEAYFNRLEDLYLKGRMPFGPGRWRWWRRHPWQKIKMQGLNLARALVLYCRLMRRIPDVALRREYRERMWKLLKVRRDPALVLIHVINCAMHYHLYSMARQLGANGKPVYNSF
jgi:hypothetical protein